MNINVIISITRWQNSCFVLSLELKLADSEAVKNRDSNSQRRRFDYPSSEIAPVRVNTCVEKCLRVPLEFIFVLFFFFEAYLLQHLQMAQRWKIRLKLARVKVRPVLLLQNAFIRTFVTSWLVTITPKFNKNLSFDPYLKDTNTIVEANAPFCMAVSIATVLRAATVNDNPGILVAK